MGTHTYATLPVTNATYTEIAEKLTAAGYEHAFHDGVIDMHGIALKTGQLESGGPSEHILQFFAYRHLPPHLQEVSAPFCRLAEQIAGTLPRNPERTVALRKLLEAKDAAVRALLAKAPA